MPLLGVNYRLPLLNISKTFVYINTREESINQFAIGYMIDPKFHVNKVFRDQVEKCLRATFHQNTMKGMKYVLIKNDTCVIVLVIFYETKTKNPIKVYRVLSCVLYFIIYNYVCIDYLWCHSKKLSIISSDKISEEASCNGLLGIGIP